MLFVNKPIEEDRFDIPDVPIEEDWIPIYHTILMDC